MVAAVTSGLRTLPQAHAAQCSCPGTLPMGFAFLPVLGFSAEDLVGLCLLVLLQLLHVPLLISVCLVKVALGKKGGSMLNKQTLLG